MKVLFGAIGAYGHLYPMMPLATAFAEAGHEVLIATGDPFLDRLELPTVRGYRELPLAEVVAEARRRHPEAEGADLSFAMFADVASELAAPTMIGLLTAERPDLVVYDAMTTAAGVAAHVVDVPAVAFGIGLVRSHLARIHRDTVRYRHDQWTTRGQHAPDSDLLADAFLDPVPRSLRASGGEVGAPTLGIRSVAYNDSRATAPDWLSQPRTRPRVYLTLGTVSFEAVEVLRRALDDLATLDVEVLVTVGPAGDPTLLGRLPESVHVEHFVAQSRVLPLVDLAIHHGGTGTVLGALTAGIPQLLLPQGADQFFNADLITAAGLGRSTVNEAQQPGVIADAVRVMLGDCAERAAAERVAAEITAMPSPAEIVPELLRLVG